MKKFFSFLFLILALGVLLGAFCDVSNAENMDNYYLNFYSNIMEEYRGVGGGDLDDLLSMLSECQYSVYCKYTAYGYDCYVVYATDVSNMCLINTKYNDGIFQTFGYASYDGSNYEQGIGFYGNTFNNSSNKFLRIAFGKNNQGVKYFYACKNNGWERTWYYGSSNIYAFYWTGVCGYSFGSVLNSYIPYDNYVSSSSWVSLGTDVYNAKPGTYLSYTRTQTQILEDTFSNFSFVVAPTYVEDDRLRIYTLETLNGKELNLNVSDFMGAWTAAVYPNFTDFTVTLNCDNMDYTFQLTDDNSEFYRVWEPYAEMFICKTLYSVFDVDQFSDVYLTAVAFNEVRSSAGGTYSETHYISCNYVLKETSEPLAPEEIPDPEYNNTFVQDSEQLIQSINDLSVDSSFYSSGSFTFEQAKVLPDWADVCDIDFEYGLSGSDSVFEGEFFYYPIDSGGVQHVQDQIVDLNSYIFERYIGLGVYYDIIRLRIFRDVITVPTLGDVNISYYDTVYIYLYSERYLKRKDAFTNLDILTVLQLEAENSVKYYQYVKDRLDDLAKDMDDGFNGFLDVNDGTQYQIINWLKTLDNDITGSLNNMQGVLTSGFSDVVSAINGIVIPSGGSSYSLPALSDELEYLFKPSLEWSAINYDDYVESLGVLALPFEFTFDVLDIAENQYDPDLKLHINNLSVDVPLEAGLNPETYEFTVLSDQDVDFQPTSVIPSALWSTLQYLNAFGLVFVQALGTYNHIFRGGDK